MGKGVWITIGFIVLALVVGFFIMKSLKQGLDTNINLPSGENSNTSGDNGGAIAQDSGGDGSAISIIENTTAKSYNIAIQSFDFVPATLTVKVGDMIKWTNMDSAGHTVISDVGGELISNRLYKNGVYNHTFNRVGTYDYHCTVHPAMKGTVIVE